MVSDLVIKLKEITYLGKSNVTDGKIHSLSLHRHTYFFFLAASQCDYNKTHPLTTVIYLTPKMNTRISDSKLKLNPFYL